MEPSRSKWRIATRAKDPLILRRSIKVDWEIILNVGTSFKIRSYIGWSKTTMFWALSLTFPLLHFFFFAPPALAAAACWDGESDNGLARESKMRQKAENEICRVKREWKLKFCQYSLLHSNVYHLFSSIIILYTHNSGLLWWHFDLTTLLDLIERWRVVKERENEFLRRSTGLANPFSARRAALHYQEPFKCARLIDKKKPKPLFICSKTRKKVNSSEALQKLQLRMAKRIQMHLLNNL